MAFSDLGSIKGRGLEVDRDAVPAVLDDVAGKCGRRRVRLLRAAERLVGERLGEVVDLVRPVADKEGGRQAIGVRDGALVLMTGMGAGLTWGSALIEWTNGRTS